jgi:hypothetical protein
MENKKKGEYYHAGDTLWRHDDNALFQITDIVSDEPVVANQDKTYYKLHCLNGVTEDDEIAYCDLVATGRTTLSPFAPSKPVKGQHVWNIFIVHDKSENEFIVESVVEREGDSSELDPCSGCDGICEQCRFGYRPKEEVLAEVGKYRKKPETIIILMNLSDHKRQTITLEQFNASFSMLPPDMYEIDKFVRAEIKSIRDNSLGCEESEKEVDDVMNDKLEKESIDTGTTVSNSYDAWRNNLKVVNVAKFDREYFQRGLAYHVKKHEFDNYEFNGIMVSVDENNLKLMKLGTHINYEYDTEIVEIPLKEYMSGLWHIVRLAEEVNK